MAAMDLANPQRNSAPVAQKGMAEFVKAKVATLMSGKAGEEFATAVVSLVNAHPELRACDNTSLVAACLQARSLNLCLHTAMGQAWIIPFENRKQGKTLATFQIGYKGYIQLAVRSGQYKKLNVLAIKEGELVSYDPLNEEIEVRIMEDHAEREKAKTMGYFAMFEYTNGFRKTMYWSREKMEAYALKYSQGYRAKKGYTFWEKDFDSMALKTMLRQILSKWGVMSPDMQVAYIADMHTAQDVGEGGNMETGEVVDVDFMEQDPPPAAVTKGKKAQADQKQESSGESAGGAEPQEKPFDVDPDPMIDCPRQGKKIQESNCHHCDQRQGCPSWE